jgi:hypothetical protein
MHQQEIKLFWVRASSHNLGCYSPGQLATLFPFKVSRCLGERTGFRLVIVAAAAGLPRIKESAALSIVSGAKTKGLVTKSFVFEASSIVFTRLFKGFDR